MDQDFVLVQDDRPAAANEAAKVLDTMYSPPTLALQKADAVVCGPFSTEGTAMLQRERAAFHSTPPCNVDAAALGPRQNVSLCDLFPALQPPRRLQQELAAHRVNQQSLPVDAVLDFLAKEHDEQQVPQVNGGYHASVPANGIALMQEMLQKATERQREIERAVPGSFNAGSRVYFDGFKVSTLPAGYKHNYDYDDFHRDLSKRFDRHVDQSQGYNFVHNVVASTPVGLQPLARALYGHGSVGVAVCGGVAVGGAVPFSVPTPVSGLTPASSTKDLSISAMVPNALPPSAEEDGGDRVGGGRVGGDSNGGGSSGGGGGGGGGQPNSNAIANNYIRDTSPQSGPIEPGDVSAPRRSLRNQDQREQQQHQQQQQPADSAATDGTRGTDATASRMSHSLYQSDGESSKGTSSYDKINPENISLEQLSTLFIYKQNAAAEILGIGSTTLKKICRNLGLNRWPSRHLNSLTQLREKLTTDTEIIGKFPEEERTRALAEIESCLRGRAVSKFLKDFRQKVFKNNHNARVKNGGVKKKK